MLKRIKNLVEKSWTTVLVVLGVGGLTDLGKHYLLHEMMAWVSERLGPLGSWLMLNPTAFLSLALGLTLMGLLLRALRDFIQPSPSQILDHNERPFDTPVSVRFTVGFVSVIIVCLFFVGYGWFAYHQHAHTPSEEERTVAVVPVEEDDDTSSHKPSSLDSDSQYELLPPKTKPQVEQLKNLVFHAKAQVLDSPDYFKQQKIKEAIRIKVDEMERKCNCLISMSEPRCLPKPPLGVSAGDVDIDISLKVVAPEISESRYWVIHNQISKLKIPIVLFVSLVNNEKEPLRISLLYLEARDAHGWADVRMADSLVPTDHTMEQKPLVLEGKNACAFMKGEYLLPSLYDRVIQPGDKVEGWIIAEYPKGFKYGSSIGDMTISLRSNKQWIASKTFSANPAVYGGHVGELSKDTFFALPVEALITERQ